MVQFTLNGIVFTLLGEQLPGILDNAMKSVDEAGHLQPWWLAVYVGAISFGLMLLRFVWVWLSLRWSILKARARGETRASPNWRIIVATSLAGVRGAITLAGVLTLPLALTDGSPFPARDLAIFLAAAVIMVSLLVAAIAQPRLLKNLHVPEESDEQHEEDLARKSAARAALVAVEGERQRLAATSDLVEDGELFTACAERVSQLYQRHVDRLGGEADIAPEQARRIEEVERQMRLAGIRAERAELFRLARERKISDEVSRKLVRNLDLLETRQR
jgi:CPA1 family monovalent cation:H+ antiporter